MIGTKRYSNLPHPGSWLYQTKVWQRIICLLLAALLMRESAWEKVNFPRDDSVDSPFLGIIKGPLAKCVHVVCEFPVCGIARVARTDGCAKVEEPGVLGQRMELRASPGRAAPARMGAAIVATRMLSGLCEEHKAREEKRGCSLRVVRKNLVLGSRREYLTAAI